MTSTSSAQKRWAVVLPAMVVPFILSWFYFVILPGTALGNGLYVSTKMLLVVWPLLATWFILRERICLALGGGRKKTGRIVAEGLGLGLGIVVLMAGFMMSPVGYTVWEGSDPIRERVEDLGVLEHFLAFALFISVVHSLIEEVFWRWFVFGNLYRLVRPWTAHLLAALAFSAHHFVVLSQYFPLGLTIFFGCGVAIGGFFWTLLVVRQGSLLGAWLSHLVVDMGLMTIGAYLMDLL